MTLVPEADYPKVRALIGDTENAIPNDAIAEAVLVAEDMIVMKIPDALTETDPELVTRYERAARYLTASILAPQMVGTANDVSQFKTGDSTVSIHARKYDILGNQMAQLGWGILEPYIVDEVASLSGSVFLLSRTPRIYRPL